MLTPGQAYDVTNVLKGVITQGTGAGYTNLPYCSEVAGKTGTSEEESDAWFVGYTPEFSTAVWVGHPQSRETTGFGGPTAGPIWRDYMEAATAGECPAFETPETPARTLGPDRRPHRQRQLPLGPIRKKKNSAKKKKPKAGSRSAEEAEEEGAEEAAEEARRRSPGEDTGAPRRRRRRRLTRPASGTWRPPRGVRDPRWRGVAAETGRWGSGRATADEHSRDRYAWTAAIRRTARRGCR